MPQTSSPNTRAVARRLFCYSGHRFDDPGEQYTTEQVRQHLVRYFPELAHAMAQEEMLPDGTLEVAFRKQVARKGTGDERDSRLLLLLAELEAVPSYNDPLAELAAALGTEPLTLAAVLDAHEMLQSHANQAFGLAGRTEQVVKRCLQLPPSPSCNAVAPPLGF